MAISKSTKQKEEKIDTLNNKALEYFDKGKWHETVKIFKQVLKIDSKNSDALVNCGGALSNAGKYKEALKYLNKALKIDPNDYSALENKGITLSKLKDKESKKVALKCFDKVLKIKPNRKYTILNKIDTLQELGLYDEKTYKKALKSRYISKLEYYHDRGAEFERKNDFKKAIQFFENAYRINSKDADISNHLAFNNISIKNYEKGLIYCNKGLKIDSKLDLLLINKIIALFNLKKYGETIKQGDKVLKSNIKLNKDDKKFILELKTESLIKLKKHSQALNSLNSLLKFDKSNSKYKKLKKKLLNKLKWKKQKK